MPRDTHKSIFRISIKLEISILGGSTVLANVNKSWRKQKDFLYQIKTEDHSLLKSFRVLVKSGEKDIFDSDNKSGSTTQMQ